MEHVKDENHVCDWSKLDEHVVKMAKTFNYTPSMFGTFDFDRAPDTTQAVQKERRTRRKAELGVEKRPVAVTQSEEAATKTTKVELVLKKIESVSKVLIIHSEIIRLIINTKTACISMNRFIETMEENRFRISNLSSIPPT